jgi:hypothetical protein
MNQKIKKNYDIFVDKIKFLIKINQKIFKSSYFLLLILIRTSIK